MPRIHRLKMSPVLATQSEKHSVAFLFITKIRRELLHAAYRTTRAPITGLIFNPGIVLSLEDE